MNGPQAFTPPWFMTDRARIFFDMHLPDWPDKGVASAFDPKALAQGFANVGADSVVFYAKCQYGNFYYRTGLGHLHSGLNGRDLFREFADAAHAYGMKVIAYYSASWDVRTAQTHPEWLTLDRFGKIFTGRWPTLCLNSPYRRLIFEHLEEIARATPADGIWLDMAIIGKDRCYCDFCTDKFQQRHGLNPPKSESAAGWLEFLDWRYETVETFFAEARGAVKAANPGIAFCNNYWGYPYMDYSMGSRAAGALKSADYVTGEGYSEWSGITSPSLFAKYLRDASGGKPFEVLLSRFHETWDFTLRPATQIAYEAYAAAANGATVTIDDEPYHDGSIEPEVYRILKPIFQEIHSRRGLITGTEPLRHAAIWYSQKTHDRFSGQTNFEFIASIVGAYKALLDEHIPVGFVFDETATLENLQRHSVILLPNVRQMDEKDLLLLKAFVELGGGVVACGPVGSLAANSIRTGLGDLFGVQMNGLSDHSVSYLRFPNDGGLHAPRLPLLIQDTVLMLSVTSGQAFGEVIDPICETNDKTYYHNNLPSPHRLSGFPAAVNHAFGAGKVMWLAGDLAKQFARSGQPALRRLIVDSVAAVAKRRLPFTVECPRTTEFLVHVDAAGRWICHFLSVHLQQPAWFDELAVSSGRAIRTKEVYEQALPVFDVLLSIDRNVRSALLHPGAQSLPIRREGGSSVISIPRIELWESVVLEFEGGAVG